MEVWKRSGQIPAFGDWKTANELPITQYFDCARQAGLIRYSNSSGECDSRDDHHQKHPPQPPPLSRNNLYPTKTRLMREKRGGAAHVKERKQVQVQVQQQHNHHHHHHQGRVRDLTEAKPQQARQQKQKHSSKEAAPQRPRIPVRAPKAVDEDLYKIPPDLLLRSSKRKKVPGFLSCFVPSACAS